MKLRLCASIPAVSEDRSLCLKYLEAADRLGLTGIEVKLGNHRLISEDTQGWLREDLEGYDFEPYAHLPYLHGNVNIASQDESLANRACQVLYDSIGYAADLGCSLVNTHLGVAIGNGPFIERAAARIDRMEMRVADMGVEIAIENQESGCNGTLNSPRDIEELLACKPDVLLTFDAGHANTNGFGVREFLPSVLPRLRYLHLHDNHGGTDEHLSLGQGDIDFGYLLSRIADLDTDWEAMPATLELRLSDLEPSVALVRGTCPDPISLI